MNLIVRLLIGIGIAFIFGKLVSKIKLPSILGWLIAGMLVGPYAIGIINEELLSAESYKILINILECSVGLMIGSELIISDLKKTGKQIVLTTITQSLGTFFVVSLAFGIIFYFVELPLYLALIFGGIALATAPAPALSIVKEFKTDGPVTKTLIPMAALDDIVGIIVFFTIITAIGTMNGEQTSSLGVELFIMVLLPILLGTIIGFIAGIFLSKEASPKKTAVMTSFFIILAAFVGIIFNNYILSEPSINFVLVGMATSAVFSNMVSKERLEVILDSFNPILGISMIIVILNLGMPLDYHLILGSGVFTLIYIVARAFGKYFGAYFGAKATKMPETVQKYLGLTLLPHSGVSLIFTGIAVTTLTAFDPVSATVVQGTIAAAAVINEVIAVIIAKKAFELAGEFHKA